MQSPQGTLRTLYSHCSLYSSDDIGDAASRVNIAYMSMPQKKAKVSDLKERAQSAEKELLKLQASQMQQVTNFSQSFGKQNIIEAIGPKIISITVDKFKQNIFPVKWVTESCLQATKCIAKEERSVYFNTDPPHLIKIPRYCYHIRVGMEHS